MKLFVFAIVIVLIVTASLSYTTGGASAAATGAAKYLVLSSYKDTSCDPASALSFNLTIPLGQCLNNHDFSAPTCDVLEKCIGTLKKQYGSTYLPYEALVNCSGAPSMHLSVKPSVSDGKLDAHVFPISKTCFGIPIPLHYANGECASTFAVSAKCGMAGSSVSWM